MTLRCLAVVVLTLPVAVQLVHAADSPGPAITLAAFGDRQTNPDQTNGDTWDTTWLTDGRVLTQYNDGNGFSSPHANVHHDGLCELQGNPENLASIQGVDLNPGKLGSFLGATYSTGIYEVDGALYHLICRSIQIPGAWQFYDTCLYKSVDGGATWLNHLGQKNQYVPENLSAATFPDKRWGEINFVKYGRGGVAPEIERAQEYVYLNGQNLSPGNWLARIRRTDLKAWTTTFAPSKIEYYRGALNADGNLDANWIPDISRCTSIYPGRAFGSILWNPGLRRYVTTSFFGDSWQNPPIPSTLFMYEAPHPWGPWTEIGSEFTEPRAGDTLGWFFLMQPFMSADGTRMWATVSGRKPYGLQFLPIDLTTQPVTTQTATKAARSGTQLSSTVKGALSPAYIDGFHKTGDACTFTFPVAKAGLYVLSYRYQCDRAGQTVSLAVNGQTPKRLPLGDTFQSKLPWNDGATRIRLTAGPASLQFLLASGDVPNGHLLLDRIQLTLLSANATL